MGLPQVSDTFRIPGRRKISEREKRDVLFSLWELTGEEKGDILLRSSRICMCLLMAEEITER